MAKKRRKAPRYVHEKTEPALTDLLVRLDVRLTQSRELDQDRKIDALVHGIETLQAPYRPIGVQITQKKEAAAKIDVFYERAAEGASGPLLYVEVHGKVTLAMAMALRNALIALWLESPRSRQRRHRLAITQSGAYWWLTSRPRQAGKT